MNNSQRFAYTVPPAIVVGACGHGLALVHALHSRGLPCLVLEANLQQPGTRTRQAQVLPVGDINGPGLIDSLLALRPRIDCPGLPVLLLTNDSMVRTVGRLWPRLEGLYRLSWSHAREALLPLLEKPALEARCDAVGLNYPRTFVLQSAEDIDAALERIPFPIFVKPARPLSRFKTAQPTDRAQLQDLVERFATDLPFLVQQFIPGDDSCIHFSALYLHQGEVLARFDGRKLRSRPLGHTSIAEPCREDAVFEHSRRFFEGLQLSGPVSLELKKDPQGRLWVIEPTVGRTDFWVGLCIANGVNLPAIEHAQEAGLQPPAAMQRDERLWFNEQRDPFGPLWLRWRSGVALRGRGSAFLFLNRLDPGPAAVFLRRFAADSLAAVGRRLLRLLGLGSATRTEPPRCSSWQDFAALRATTLWQGLSGSAASLFETPQWLDHLAASCPAPGRLELLGVASGGSASLLALRRHPNGRLESLSNYYAALFGPVASAPADLNAHAQAYAAWIANSGAPVLRLHPLAADAPFWSAFSSALQAQGFWVGRYFAFANWLQPVQGQGWADYLAARPSRLRHTIQRVRKKLAATPGFRGQLLDASCDAATLEQAIADFGVVYAHSWKRPEPFPDFVPGLCRLAHAQGWLRMGLCHLDGKPVAAQIWLVHGGSAAIFKLAYDAAYARHGVGTWVSAALSQQVLDVDRVAEIDFLAGDDVYKAEWMSQRRERIGLIAFRRRSLQGMAAAALHFGAGLVRRGSRLRRIAT